MDDYVFFNRPFPSIHYFTERMSWLEAVRTSTDHRWRGLAGILTRSLVDASARDTHETVQRRDAGGARKGGPDQAAPDPSVTLCGPGRPPGVGAGGRRGRRRAAAALAGPRRRGRGRRPGPRPCVRGNCHGRRTACGAAAGADSGGDRAPPGAVRPPHGRTGAAECSRRHPPFLPVNASSHRVATSPPPRPSPSHSTTIFPSAASIRMVSPSPYVPV